MLVDAMCQVNCVCKCIRLARNCNECQNIVKFCYVNVVNCNNVELRKIEASYDNLKITYIVLLQDKNQIYYEC
jgi:hypothetical protein